MRRKIPSTLALTVFEAAARHQSYTLAAAELSLTQSAVCRQIAALESFVGVKLFRRSRRGVVLSDAGVQYARSVSARLDEVERDTLELMSQGGRSATLELAVVPTFGTQWLLPRLGAFAALHPEIRVNLSSRARPFLFDGSQLDAAIHAGEQPWPGTVGHLLWHESLIPVAAPSLLKGIEVRTPADWMHLPLLHISTRPYAWRQWFEALGLRFEGDMSGSRFELFSMVSQAAVHGLGVGLVPRFLVEQELASQRLVPLAEHEFASHRSYLLLYPEAHQSNTALQLFRQWLESEAARYRATQTLPAQPPDPVRSR